MANPPGPHPYPYPNQPYGQPYSSPGTYPPAAVRGQHSPVGEALSCEICGGVPAVRATVRGHQGMVVLMRFLKRSGVFCGSCGTSLHRKMTADTLYQGWWSPLSLIFTPITVLANVLGPRPVFRRLGPPSGGRQRPLDPGKRVLLRPAALVFALPIALVVLAVPLLMVIGLIAGDAKPDQLSVGDCVRNNSTWPAQDLEAVVCGSSPDQYRVSQELTGPGDTCKADGPEIPYIGDPKYSANGHTLCLSRVH
ncbi:hypothetical protein AB0F13_20550 [Streptomyces sp. NPDC026206]|uniref:LppU/SCO3897 family protein n=1 Tax=Streptomyces sp. NPDC026206 TaxID=3157089 RepID=UPI0033C27C10